MAKRYRKNRTADLITQLDQAIRYAQSTGTFDGVHPKTARYATRQGLALPDPAGDGWVLTDQGRAYRQPTA
jgi:hypothetical protein